MKLRLYVFYLFGILLLSSFASALLTDGLFAYYSFDTDATDYFGVDNLTGNAVYNTTVTKLGGGAYYCDEHILNGSNGMYWDGLNKTEAFSVSFWVYPRNTSSRQAYATWQDNDDNAIFLGWFPTNPDHLQYAIGSATIIGNTTFNATNQWIHIVLVHNGTTGASQMWQNGNSLGTGTDTRTWGGSSLTLCRRDWGVTGAAIDYAHINIDEFAGWNRSLTPAEVAELYNSGAGYNPYATTTINITSVYLTSPDPDQKLYAPLVTGNTSDTTPIFNLTTDIAGNCSYSTDNATWNTCGTTDSTAHICTQAVALSDGLNSEYFKCNTTTSDAYVNVSFLVDATAPNLNIVYPAANGSWFNSSIGINYTAVDTNGISACWWTNTTGSNITLAGCANITGQTWSQGTNDITIYTNDTYNNVNSSSRQFNIDTLYPTIDFVSPTEANNTNFSRTWIYANVSITEIYHNRTNITLWNSTALVSSSSGNSTNFTSLSDGTYYLNVTVYDMAENSNSTVTRQYILDTTAPTFYDNQTNDSSPRINDVINISIRVNDTLIGMANTTLYWDGGAGTFVKNDTFVHSGNSVFTSDLQTMTSVGGSTVRWFWEAFDVIGNSANSTTETLTVENTPPPQVTSWVFPSIDPDHDNYNISFDWDAVVDADGDTVNYLLYLNDSLMYNGTDSNWTANFTTEGDHGYIVSTWDGSSYGVNSTLRVFTLDTIIPVVTWHSPTLTQTYSNQNLTLNFTASDANLYQVAYNITNSSGATVYSQLFDDRNTSTFNSDGLFNFTYNDNFSIEVEIVDDHSNGTKPNNHKKSATEVVFYDALENVSVTAYMLKDNNQQPMFLPANFDTILIEHESETIIDFNFTKPPNAGYLILNITSLNNNLVYRELISGIKAHTIWGKSSIDFQDAFDEGFNISTDVLNDKQIQVTFDLDSCTDNDLCYIGAGMVTGLNNISETRYYYYDVIYPTISFVSPTEADNTNFSRTWIYANVSVVDVNYANTTINLYNSSSTLISTAALNNTNFTGLSDGTYYLNATVCDLAGNCNSTGTRTYMLDTTAPTIAFTSPTEANNTNFSRTWIYANVSVADTNYANTTINLYNSSSTLVNTSALNNTNFTLLIDDTYYLNATACDTVGNCNSTVTRQYILDDTSPTVTLVSPTNNTASTSQSQVFSCNTTDNLIGISNTTLHAWHSGVLYYNSTTNLSGTSNSTSWTTTLAFGTYEWNCRGYDALGNTAWASSNYTLTIRAVVDSGLTGGIGGSTGETSLTSINTTIESFLDANKDKLKSVNSLLERTLFKIPGITSFSTASEVVDFGEIEIKVKHMLYLSLFLVFVILMFYAASDLRTQKAPREY